MVNIQLQLQPQTEERLRKIIAQHINQEALLKISLPIKFQSYTQRHK